MVSFEIFVKAMPSSLLELKVLPSFCFTFKIPDDVTASKSIITLITLKKIQSNRTCPICRGDAASFFNGMPGGNASPPLTASTASN